MLDEWQTEQTQIRRHVLRRLIWVCTVPSGLSGLLRENAVIYKADEHEKTIFESNPDWLQREKENLLHPFEVTWDKSLQRPRADVSKMVKEYRRPTVGKDDNEPEDVRPPHVLRETVNYLIDSVAVQQVSWSEIYDFMFDRLRAVRQDLVIQHSGAEDSVEILEKAVRFHLYSDYRLCMEHISVFDPKINNQHIQECLKRLLNFYRHSARIYSNRVEFESIYLLFNLGDFDALKHFLSLDKSLRKNLMLRQAYEISLSYLLGNWVRVIKLLKKIRSPVLFCAIHRHFPFIQRKIIHTMCIAYSSRACKFPISKLTEMLCLNTDAETQTLCQQFGLSVLGSNVQFLKSSFQDYNRPRQQLDFISSIIRQDSIPDVLHGRTATEDSLCVNFKELCKT